MRTMRGQCRPAQGAALCQGMAGGACGWPLTQLYTRTQTSCHELSVRRSIMRRNKREARLFEALGGIDQAILRVGVHASGCWTDLRCSEEKCTQNEYRATFAPAMSHNTLKQSSADYLKVSAPTRCRGVHGTGCRKNRGDASEERSGEV